MLAAFLPSWVALVVSCVLSFLAGALVRRTADQRGASRSARHTKAGRPRGRIARLSADGDATLAAAGRTPDAAAAPSPAVAVATAAVAAPPMKLGHLNLFLHYDCAPALLGMGLFPNAQEIAESMACLQAVDKHLPSLRFSDAGAVCVIVGDGVAPRTAALAAMRTKWRRVISVDPVLHTGTAAESESPQQATGGVAAHAGYARKGQQTQAKLERLDRQLAQWRRVERLEMLALPVEQTIVDIDAARDRHILVVLPHAHVVPESALGALRLEAGAGDPGGALPPAISVVQLPCCSYAKHATVCGLPPDVEYVDDRICGDRHGCARTVRVWRDVAREAVALRAVRLGDRVPLTSRLLARKRRNVGPADATAAGGPAAAAGAERGPPGAAAA